MASFDLHLSGGRELVNGDRAKVHCVVVVDYDDDC